MRKTLKHISSGSMNELLHVSDFSLQIGSLQAVQQISFSVDAGEQVSIVGESGSGKTVTALSLLGLQPGNITSGKAIFHTENKMVDLFSMVGKQLHSLRGKEIGYVFQEPGLCLNPSITCGKQVAEVIRFHLKKTGKEAHSETLRWFSKIGFSEPERMYNSYPHQLSGGQKQRVMLAIAMAPDPKLLIADEPTTALDVTVQKQIMELLHTLCMENNTALLFITHDLGLAKVMGNRTLIMHQGKIVEQGHSKELFSNPRHPYTQQLAHTRITMKTPPAFNPVINSEIIVSAKNITASYTDSGLFITKSPVYALDDISFTIQRGETLGLVGGSGSGKSTLGQILMGLKTPDSGNVEIFGKNIFAMEPDELRLFRKKFRVIFQDPFSSFNPKISIGSQIEETMAVYNMYASSKKRKEKAAEWLERVGLKPEDAHRLPDSFSGGQRQRIAIARALACEPEFLVCDECVSSLDVSLQREILNLLLQLQAQFNMGLLFISHDPATVKFMCENVMVLKDGNLMEYGRTADVWENPISSYTKGLLDAVV
jgi:peptide/nickel transport system ATP-binding protein